MIKQKIIPTNTRFGKLIVLGLDTSKLPKERNNKSFYICKCDCGMIKSVMGHSLINKHTQSCGCLRLDKAIHKAKQNIGRKFGKLVVLEVCIKDNRTYYKCQCECGVIKDILVNSIHNGKSKSCGCGHIESIRKHNTPTIYNKRIAAYISKAKKHGLEWNLTYEDCVCLFSLSCTYCGIASSNHVTYKGEEKFYNGIDRIDSNKGYTKDNVTTACVTCNKAKNDLSLEEFINWIARIHLRLGGGIPYTNFIIECVNEIAL